MRLGCLRPRTPATRRARLALLGAAVLSAATTGVGASAAANRLVGPDPGSSGEPQPAEMAKLTVTGAPGGANRLYPGGNGDVTVSIGNPNPFPVTVTAVQLPTDTTYAAGYSTSALTTAQPGCSASTPSGVTWRYSSAANGSSHDLVTPLTVAAKGSADDPLVVTLTDAAAMTSSAPAACVDTYFSMPQLAGVTAIGGAATVTASPATDSWTS